VVLLVGCCGSWSCGSRGAAGSPDGAADRASDTGATIPGAGTSIYLRNSLSLLPAQAPGAETVMVASVLGLTTVEQLSVGPSGAVQATPVDAPGSASSVGHIPISLRVVDVNGDATSDVLVMDTAMGNWVALGQPAGAWRSVPAVDLLGQLPAFESFAVFDVPAARQAFAGLVPGLELTLGSKGKTDGQWGTAFDRPLPDFSALVPVVGPFLIAGSLDMQADGVTMLLQGRTRLFAISAPALLRADGAISDFSTLKARAVQAPYVVPFDAFDHFAPLTVNGCPAAALGIGVFSQAGGQIPRQLQVLSLTAVDFDVREQATPFDVVTFDVVPSIDRSFAVVGVIGRSGGQHLFAVYRTTGCGSLEEVAEVATDFDWRAPEAPAFGENGPYVPKTDGVTLAGAADDTGRLYSFWHYDGYDMRQWVFSADAADASAGHIQASKARVHDTRTDLAFD
jgi:hypothetical protein